MTIPHWLNWARKIQAISQIGLTFAENIYDRERYEKLQELAHEIFATETGMSDSVVKSWFTAQSGYATPKVDVRGACFHDDKILLVRERADNGWCLPGGWADVGDVPSIAVEREVFEEAGYVCKANKIVGIFDANRHGTPLSAYHAYKLIILCNLIGGEGKHNHETSAVGFFSRAEINTLPLSTPRSSLDQLQICFEHHTQPQLPSQFD
jgi:ADP-ribose pyrophosphatase YjhB (NUDIX family)